MKDGRSVLCSPGTKQAGDQGEVKPQIQKPKRRISLKSYADRLLFKRKGVFKEYVVARENKKRKRQEYENALRIYDEKAADLM